MDVANELLDAIEIIVDKKIRENTAQIYPGICKSVSGNSCVMSINGKDNTIQFYGSIPTVGAIYRVFVPDGNMSMAFAITGNDDRKGLQYSNSNLLDNWYFGNPVNQRGQTSYTAAGYGIDRWYLNLSSSTAGGIQILDDCIQFIANGGTHIIEQRIEGLEDISGKTVTLSVLVDTFGLVSVTTVLGSIKYKYFNGSTASDGYMSVEQKSSGIVSIVIGSNGTTRKVYAAKLELGTTQTLAHQENGVWVLNEIPNYGEQLARCQRYFQLYSTAGNRPSKAVDCRPAMHTDPSQGTIIIDGTTYYYNTADL